MGGMRQGPANVRQAAAPSYTRPSVHAVYSAGGSAVSTSSTLLTAEGIWIDCDRPPPVGTSIDLVIRSSEASAPLSLRATVRSASPAGFRAAFGVLDLPQRDLLWGLLTPSGMSSTQSRL